MLNINSKRSAQRYWSRRKKLTIALRATRAEELAAIEQHITARGLTPCPPSEQYTVQAMQNAGPNPMPGWR